MLNSERNKLNIIVLLVTDITLLLTVLVGLLRLRGDGIGTFGVGKLLWKQVGFRSLYCSQSSDMFSFCKGALWLLVATVAEVPPAVNPAVLLHTPVSLIAM